MARTTRRRSSGSQDCHQGAEDVSFPTAAPQPRDRALPQPLSKSASASRSHTKVEQRGPSSCCKACPFIQPTAPAAYSILGFYARQRCPRKSLWTFSSGGGFPVSTGSILYSRFRCTDQSQDHVGIATTACRWPRRSERGQSASTESSALLLSPSPLGESLAWHP